MKKYEREIKKYLVERKWDTLPPGDLAKSISIEASELLELFQWSNPTVEETLRDKEKIEKIKGELADILIYCLDLSVTLKLDTSKLIMDKLDKVKKKYPAKLVRDIRQHGDEIYWKIKDEHRRKGR